MAFARKIGKRRHAATLACLVNLSKDATSSGASTHQINKKLKELYGLKLKICQTAGILDHLVNLGYGKELPNREYTRWWQTTEGGDFELNRIVQEDKQKPREQRVLQPIL